MQENQQLSKTLKPRHLSVVAIAGAIGAGLFGGSGVAIQQAGPGILIAYADKAFGRWAGFSIGWLYAWFWIIVPGVEAPAGAGIMHRWLPAVDQWEWALALMVLLTLTNIASVKS